MALRTFWQRPLSRAQRLLAVAWNGDSWTFDVLVRHYKTLVRYLDLEDRGMMLGYGCGTETMTKESVYPHKAYELGRNL